MKTMTNSNFIEKYNIILLSYKVSVYSILSLVEHG